MTDYIYRLIDPLIDELLAELPALMLIGPRATGKTTTAARHARTIVRLDRPAEAIAFRADPDAALRNLQEPVLLDEWQEVPEVLGAVKRAVDADNHPGRFLLAGSVRADLDAVTWPGTGRVVRVRMYPMTVAEQVGSKTASLVDRIVAGVDLTAAADSPDLRGYVDLALLGGFPDASLSKSSRARERWLGGYIDQVLTRDTAAGNGYGDPALLRQYFNAYVLNSAGLADHKTIYDAAGINKNTAVRFEALLKNLMIVEHIPAWSSNRLKRLARSPKRYVVDTSIMGSAISMDTAAFMADGDMLGRLLDTFATAQLRAEAEVAASRPTLYHARWGDGRYEIDLVAELAGNKLVGIEIKADSAPTPSDAKHLERFREHVGERYVGGVVLHTGPSTYQLTDGVVAAPISTLWS